MINSFHSTVVVLRREARASPQEIKAFERRFPELPRLFFELYSAATEIELSYKGKYLRLYGPRGCVEMDEAYGISKRIPGAMTVGDNGGGEAIIFLRQPKPGLYRVGYGALALEDAIYIAPTLESILFKAQVEAQEVGGVTA